MTVFSLCFLIFLSLLAICCGANPTEERQWIDAVTKLDKVAHPFKQEFADHMKNITSDVTISISDNCRQGLEAFSSGLMNHDMDSMALFDSFSRPAPGLLTMASYSLGSYEQCLMYGRYVLLGIQFPLPEDASIRMFHSERKDWRYEYSKSISARRLHPFEFAVCVPKSCQEADVRTLFASQYVTSRLHPLTAKILSVESRSDPFQPSVKQAAAILVLSLIISIGVAAASLNYYLPDSPLAKRLKAFDVTSNAVLLFSQSTSETNIFTNIALLRSVYFINSALAHLVTGIYPETQMIRMEALSASRELVPLPDRNFDDAMVLFAPGFMTSNMVIAACFATAKWIPVMSTKKVSVLMYAMDRVARTLPVVFTYFIVTQALPILPVGWGPLMKRSQVEYVDVCARNGWKELLYVNNFHADIRQVCNPVAWFMSAEMQLYLMSFVVFYLIAKFPKFAVKIVGSLLLSGIAISALVFRATGIEPIMSMRQVDLFEDMTNYTSRIYHTWNYVSVYAIGIFMGLFVVRTGGKKQPLSWSFIAMVIASNGIMWLPWLVYDDSVTRKFRFGPEMELVFASTLRLMAAGNQALNHWLIMNTSNSIIGYLAQTQVVTVIARLSLSWFMVHVMFVVGLIAAHADGRYSKLQILMEHIFLLVTSFPFAVLMNVFVETPFSHLWNHFKRNRHSLRDPDATLVDQKSKDS